MKKILTFRLDDITPGMNQKNFHRFEQIFSSRGIRPMLGIVPCNEDPKLIVDEISDDFWNDMRRLQDDGWPIAQHGYKHVYSNECSGILQANPFSEFAGVDYERQREMVFNGKEILESHGLRPDYFMAPGHTFDENTLKALVANGIFSITDGYTNVPYIREGVVFYPCTLSDAKVPNGVDTVCIHLNNWDDSDFAQFEEFLDENIKICGNFNSIKENCRPIEYDEKTGYQEEKFRKLRERKQKAADSEKMQRYLQKSYSDNKVIKVIKRCLFLPMLLRK